MNTTRRNFGFALVLALATAVAHTSQSARAEETRTIDHVHGKTQVAGHPTRVIAMEFSFVQALDVLGVTPVGIADDNQPKRIEQLVGRKIDYSSVGTRLEPNLELVSTLSPDLIIADDIRHAALYSQLSQLAPTIVLNSWEGNYQTIKEAVVTIADALGEKTTGDEIIAAHEARIRALIDKIPPGEKRRFLLAVANPDTMSLHTSASFSGSVFQAIGLIPAVDSKDAVESGAGLERLVAVNPDVLLVATDKPGTVFDQWKCNAAWQNISAVKNGMVFEVDRNQFSRFRGLKTAELMVQEILAKVYKVE
ncbi:ABC transporter substrate-binding protein [Sinorhizobium mexicanum]|uniref:ABC transporter substrate-binding protein n=1 Tax=Sinorhizobium mexicanum TaxID=375549 RepID=A0A859QHN8_9HYPH|nr:ABC transporter substrate-binding protein [Sinorhizobium mexicanum]MBP1886390.1 iron complex transport system substrate-binding protein [Sinorhizobium mexicanum]QLL64014.1 ABC transporter substrate-binding protein [Sinorhizobium mexicanum]